MSSAVAPSTSNTHQQNAAALAPVSPRRRVIGAEHQSRTVRSVRPRFRYHDLMARGRGEPEPATGDADVSVLDAFLDWCQNHRAART